MPHEYEVFDTDIAIVGMALRVPGAKDIRQYWRNLRDGVESIRTYTDEELIAAGESPENLHHERYVRAGAPLDDMEMFDAEFFGFSPKDAAILDPQHRHFLECCWEALEDAGRPPARFGGPIGLFAGCGVGRYLFLNLMTHPELVRDVGFFLLRHTGNDKDFLASRVSYLLDLRGPALGVQTACSSSLVATHLATQSLLSRECDMALAGGVTIELPHRRGYVYEEGEHLSPDGHCHAFDRRAQGTVFSSGAAVLALRRLEDAIDDGDVIHAVIRGSAVNNDGATKVNYFAPSVDGQAACAVEAYGVGNVDPRTIEYIECHGTGTYLGDPIEVSALTQAFRTATDERGFCRLGSVKSNIGHLDTAAGAASLIKAALSLEHAQIPPTISFESPNPNIDFDGSPFRVASELTDWPAPERHPRRAAVNSLGIGGTNAHVVLQEPPALATGSEATRPLQLLSLSAKSGASLERASERLATHLRQHPEQALADVAWTLRHGRQAFERRRVVVARSAEEGARLLEEGDPRRVFTHTAADDPSVVLLLPGGGAQYPGMARDLYESEPVFREHVEAGLSRLAEAHGIDLRPLLFPAPGQEADGQEADGQEADGQEQDARRELDRMSRQLPAIFIVSVAMARLLESWGVTPAALLGHSLGENTAAHLAGVMSFEDCLGLVVLRGRLFERTSEGAMLSVNLPADELRSLMGDELDLAVINAPESTVVSGPPAAIDALARTLSHMEEVEARRLSVPTAAHSRQLDPILEEFGAYLRSIELSPPKIPFASNTTGTWITDEEAVSPDYWVRHLRSTVRFADDVAAILDTGDRVLVECGPGRTLSSLARQHPAFRDGTHGAVCSIRHRDEEVDDAVFFTTCLGRIWASGADFDWDRLWPGEERVRVALPTYAWNHKPYFIEPGKVQVEEDSLELSKLQDVGDWGYEPFWKPSLADPREGTGPHTWLIFMDAGGVGRRLRERLERRGDRVVAVYEGDAYAERARDEYSLSPERGQEGYAALIADLVARGKTPDRVVHLWLLETEPSYRAGSSLFHHHQERGFYSLFFLARAIVNEGLPTPLALTVVTHGMQRVGDEPLPHPDKATVLGPTKVLPRELDGVRARAIDVQLPRRREQLFGGTLRMALADPFGGKRRVEQELDELVDRLHDELLSPPADEIVALRAAKRFTQVFEPRRLDPADERPAPLRDRGVYLVTGGLGGLGLTVAEHLARSCQARLVLISRTPLPPREQWAQWMRQHGAEDRISRRLRRLLDVEDAGGEIMVASADVTNLEEMKQVVASATERFGAIHGVFHAAGRVDDQLIAAKTQASVEEVFTPKIQGTMVLDELFRDAERPLELMVLFSSTSVATAPAGQVDYVAANAFLDAYAESKASGPTRTLSLHWGVWKGVGMAAEQLGRRDEVTPGEVVGEQPRQPLLDARIRDAWGSTVLSATYSASTHWILDGHRTKAGHALVPGTGYLELARQALRASGESGPFEIEDLFFLRPLAVPDGEERQVHVRLRPTQRGYAFEVRGRVQVDGEAGWEPHAQAHLTLRPLPRPPAVPIPQIERRCDEHRVDGEGEALPSPQEAHLRFGPRWRVLRRASFGFREGLAHLALEPAYASEVGAMGLHPALLDISTGWAMELIEGYGAESLWVPVSYERVRVYGDLPASVVSWVRCPVENRADAEFAYFDVVLADESGQVLVEVDRLALRKMQGEVDFTVKSRPSARDLEMEPRPGAEREPSPAERALMRNLERGILAEEGCDALFRVLASEPRPQVYVSSMDLAGLIRQADRGLPRDERDGGLKLARPDLGNDYVEPRDEVEKTLVSYWQELLGVETVGVTDSFFDLGGHSLIAVRLFAKVKKAYQVEFPISVLFEAPTIERCAALIRDAIGDGAQARSKDGDREPAPRSRYTHLVPMHPGDGGPKTPFFLVAGMFGNVLNLRHLANLVGTDRRFYGLQARGLYGDQKPHETFEEMAQAYLAEIRTVQPRGPYLLGGFSGGGITAYEMARQLRSEGEEVALLVMLDTPLPFPPPRLSLRDRVRIQKQQLEHKGPAYVGEWAARRWHWELGKLKRRFEDAEPDRAPDEFHDEAIEQAFRRALSRYELQPWPGRLTLFRPPLQVAYDLGNGRLLDADRNYVYEDNGWTDWVGRLDVFEVPGDHDSMVLEPNVRVLSRKLRDVIEQAEAEIRRAPLELAREAAE